MKPSLYTLTAGNLLVSVGGKTVVDGLDLTLEKGRLTLLLGSNGAGKSTLLRTLAGIQPFREGTVHVDGDPLNRMSQRNRAHKIAYLPQSLRTPFAFTVREFLKIGDVNELLLTDALEAMELAPILPRALTTLSGGERQRTAVARALGSDAPVMLLDEPTAHLDLRHSLRLLHYLKMRTSRDTAILVATHDLTLLLPFAERVLILANGTISFDGTPRELTPEALERGLGVEKHLLPDAAFPGI